MNAPRAQRRPIRLLDPSCVERIAAGEVVERPASAIKELVENALDAGAEQISVRLRRGGLEQILVEDDGSGIPMREMPLAVERHATSKIAGSGDLLDVHSFGFRGEALASIASVSRFSLRSRHADEDVGCQMDLAGGRLEKKEAIARHVGTTVIAADLFFNLPARREFLKGETAERRAVSQVMTALSLAHPEVGFRLESDGKVLIDLPGALDLETRVHGVFGSSVAEHLRRFEAEMDGLRVEGLCSLPTYTRGNRTGQHLFVNRRPIQDKNLSHAIQHAYREVTPAGRFPLALVFLELPPSRIDVNIHPAKTEIRFRDGARLHELIRHAMQDALSLRRERGEESSAAQAPMSENLESPEARALGRLSQDVEEIFQHGPTEGHASSYGPSWSRRKEEPTLFDASSLKETPSAFEPSGALPDPGLGGEALGSTLFWQLHNTFILTQIRGALVIVDQHNSHERILYNEGKQALAGRGAAVQQLLFPTTMELTPEELAVYEVHAGDLEKMGFVTEPFGGSTILVRGIPAELRNWNEGALLRDILADMGDAGRGGHDPREAILASYACHGAIRAGEAGPSRDAGTDGSSLCDRASLFVPARPTDLDSHRTSRAGAALRSEVSVANRARSLVVLVGATASGKTDLALSLVARFPGQLELVSLDSRQIYRELQLGTGKPSPEERERLPHHLIDLIDPDERFDAGRYRRAVEELLPSLWERGVTPMVVGGAGFYLRSLTDGFFDLPEDREQLERVRSELHEVDLEELGKRLLAVDPASATRLHPNDRYRIERALEIHAITGRSMSELTAEFQGKSVLDLDLIVHHLQLPRWQLHGRIARRARTWLEGTWIQETQSLLDAGWAADSPGLGILGYREIVEHLADPLSDRELEERVVVATRQYARQQETWFRKLPVALRATRENPALADALLEALEASRPT